MQWRDFIQNPVRSNETLQNSTRIVTFPLTPLEIKDERCTHEHTVHSLYKIAAKGWHLGLDSILKNPFGSLVWASVAWKPGTVFYWTQPSILRLPQFFHFVSQMHAVRGHPEASIAAWRLNVKLFPYAVLHSKTTIHCYRTPFAGVFTHCSSRAIMMLMREL